MADPDAHIADWDRLRDYLERPWNGDHGRGGATGIGPTPSRAGTTASSSNDAVRFDPSWSFGSPFPALRLVSPGGVPGNVLPERCGGERASRHHGHLVVSTMRRFTRRWTPKGSNVAWHCSTVSPARLFARHCWRVAGVPGRGDYRPAGGSRMAINTVGSRTRAGCQQGRTGGHHLLSGRRPGASPDRPLNCLTPT